MQDLTEVIRVTSSIAKLSYCRILGFIALFLLIQVLINVSIFAKKEEYDIGYIALTIICILMYIFTSFKSPGHIVLKNKEFSDQMKAVEIKMKNGDISYLPTTADMKMNAKDDKKNLNHARKTSVLTKTTQIGHHKRRRAADILTDNGKVTPKEKAIKYTKFIDETELGSVTARSNFSNIETQNNPNKRKKIIGKFSPRPPLPKSANTTPRMEKTLKLKEANPTEDLGLNKLQAFQNSPIQTVASEVCGLEDIEENKLEVFFDTKTIQNTEVEVEIKIKPETSHKESYCSVCKVPQPLRTIHCYTCRACVCCYDHHSYLIGTCVGEYNRREHFFLLILLLTQCMMALHKVFMQLDSQLIFPFSVVMCIVFSSLFLILSIPCLLILILHQMYMVIFNWTIHEKYYSKLSYLAKTQYATSNPWKSFFCYIKSPFSKGICGNFSDFFCKCRYRVTEWKYMKAVEIKE
ncbi:unnamed protein product [Moneuplotes crassus]|uniref:Palmitoyltransferase n=1 Tax=Euplotes crassus TaxID=5936 RepID=A0AAD1U8Y0_EUPCR|nr:unnamed protein product [Moneuplotes crassus]